MSPVRISHLLLLAAVCCAQPAAAQWKWINAAGVVQYSDQPPPPGTPTRNVLARPASRRPPPDATSMAKAPAAPGSAASASALQRKIDQDERARHAAQQLQQEVADQARLHNCQQAQAQWQALNSGQRIAQPGPDGGRSYLSDAELAARRQQVQAAIAQYCR